MQTDNARMNTPQLQLAGALGHEATDKRIDILRRIGETGSISEAARAAGVSYKAGWQAIDTLSNLAGVALVERVVGGVDGPAAVPPRVRGDRQAAGRHDGAGGAIRPGHDGGTGGAAAPATDRRAPG